VIWGFTFVAADPEEAIQLAKVERISNRNVPSELIAAIECAVRVMPQGQRIRVYAFSGRAPDGAVLNVCTV
jgi:hypothetical protein